VVEVTFDRSYYEAQGRNAGKLGGICCSEPTVTAAVVAMARKYLSEASRIIDVGCGANLDYDRFLVERLNKRLVGIDFSFSFLDLAPQIKGVALVQGDATALPIVSGSVDAVICSETLEHIKQDAQAIKEIATVLRPGGVLLLTVPNLWNASRLLEMTKKRNLGIELMPGHVREYSIRSIGKLLQPYFSIVKWYAVGFGWSGPLGAPLDLLVKLGVLKRFSKSLALACLRRHPGMPPKLL
jgi:SAM-dependent methyltransferase